MVRIGAVSVEPARCDKDANTALAERMVARCAEQGADLVVLPEGFLEGYVVNEPGMTRERFLELAESVDGPYARRFRALAQRLGIWLLACFAEREGEAVYNSAFLIDPSGAYAGRYRKTHVQSGGDWRFYAPGEELPVFSTPWGPVGVMICYDRQFPEVPRALMRQGARLVLNPSWGMFNELNETMMRTRAYENGLFIVFAHVKGALVLDPRGNVAERSAPQDEILVHTIDLQQVDEVRRKGRGHLTDHLRPELYARAAQTGRSMR
ncbi:MAG: carbon-nitrogen hydrolase family protein [Chloroflexi bacterium]|nr:carbon-nitrogen hydrolase family protein [Chloroflexota bacterium]